MTSEFGPGVNALDEVLTKTQRALAAMRSTPADADPEAEPACGRGTAAGGLIRATVTAASRLRSLEVDSPAMRLDSTTLAEEIVSAVNAAFDDLAEQATEHGGATAAADPAVLATQLQELQEQSVRQMAVFGQELTDVLRRLGGASGPSGAGRDRG